MSTEDVDVEARPHRPVPVRLAGQAVHGLRRVLELVLRAPLTLVFLVALWTVGALTGSLVEGPPDSLLAQVGVSTQGLGEGRWWTPFSSALWCLGLAGYLLSTVLVLGFGAAGERWLGARRTALVFAVSQVGGVLVGMAVIKLGSLAGWVWLNFLDNPDELALSPSIGAAGVGLALSSRLPVLWRRRLRLVLVVALVTLALFSGYALDVARLSGGLVGLLAGRLMFGRSAQVTGAPSRSETRVLVALLLAACALGPVFMLLTPYTAGPLTALADVLTSPTPSAEQVEAICADPDQAEWCRELKARASFDGLPSAVLSVLPALFLLVLAEGLRRGRRLAWWVALWANLALVVWFVQSIVDLALTPAERFVDYQPYTKGQLVFDSAGPVLICVAMLAGLVLTRRHFTVAGPKRSRRRLAGFVAGAFLGLAALYVLAGWGLREDFDPVPTFGQLLADAPGRFLPPGYLDLFPVHFIATGTAAELLCEYLGVTFWLLVLGALLATFWRAALPEDETAAARARELTEKFGGSTLAHMTTWRGNSHWFTDDGRAAVAYRVVATIAITTGDPVGEPDARGDAVRGFADFCARNGWTPCFYSVTQDVVARTGEFGWSAVQVAEDTLVPLPELAFTGKKWQDVRTALNKAGKAGITAEWWRYPDAPLAITDQVRSISEEWVADKGLPEMGFTLGGLDELNDPGVRCLVALDADRTVHGITSWLPVHRDGEVVGWTLDFMRRRATGFRGVMEFLIASAALSFKEEGAEFLSLSGAPLARLDRGTTPGTLQRLLDFAGRALEPVYGFRSLFAFKAKFQPTYQPLYMAYPDPAALPRIANAIGRAYLPDMGAKQGLRLVRRVLSR
ncbi:lysylphosphatidylglycerol synthetase-like protein (DUF2156 family) [Crossiella equi]|uniref:Lysylphosphatidylglycerol synthetase-like protein (DUF2156 family) n=1 Tax=Crossiella equi TaxID=130796 RepID=A0ABS5ADM1_9PSEU|nr:phosphatidylglycerol lysyltransferase domain-containing protein [Crossiella equi]MBP2474402.1 lysylphosphatidylglycerol synthetase-like protein (DUF2156 family) [Crossiella equi]